MAGRISMWLRHVLRARVRANISNKNAQRQRKSWRNQCTRGQRLETPDKRCYPGNLICKALSGAASLLPQWGQTYLSMVGSMGARTPLHRCMLSQPVKHKRGIDGQNAPTPDMKDGLRNHIRPIFLQSYTMSNRAAACCHSSNSHICIREADPSLCFLGIS